MSGYICINGHRSASCIYVEGQHRMCLTPGCKAEAEMDDDAGLSAALRQAYREGVEAMMCKVRRAWPSLEAMEAAARLLAEGGKL